MSDEHLKGVFAAGGDAAAIIDAARQTAIPVKVDPTQIESHVFVIPEGAKLDRVDFEEWHLPRPRRLTGDVHVEDVASFEAYVREFYDADATTLWVNAQDHRVMGVLDDAHRDTSAWREHRVTLQLVTTPEWRRWRAADGKLMSQEEFARHIEISELDVVTPDAAELLEIAQTFYASTTAEFRSGTRLQSGEVQFSWVEEQTATAGRNGELSIPAKFELRVAPFHGEDLCAVTALLRYRVREGKLTIGYELVRPADVERDAMQLIAERLKTSFTRVYTGSPAS